MVVKTGLWFHIYAAVYGARNVKGTTALWRHKNPLFLDVMASFSRTIFKRREYFFRLNVLTVKFPLILSLFPFILNRIFFDVILLMVQYFFQIQQEIKKKYQLSSQRHFKIAFYRFV